MKAYDVHSNAVIVAREEGREEGRILTVKIFQEAQRNPQATSEQIAEKVGCKAQEVTDTLQMFGI